MGSLLLKLHRLFYFMKIFFRFQDPSSLQLAQLVFYLGFTFFLFFSTLTFYCFIILVWRICLGLQWSKYCLHFLWNWIRLWICLFKSLWQQIDRLSHISFMLFDNFLFIIKRWNIFRLLVNLRTLSIFNIQDISFIISKLLILIYVIFDKEVSHRFLMLMLFHFYVILNKGHYLFPSFFFFFRLKYLCNAHYLACQSNFLIKI